MRLWLGLGLCRRRCRSPRVVLAWLLLLLVCAAAALVLLLALLLLLPDNLDDGSEFGAGIGIGMAVEEDDWIPIRSGQRQSEFVDSRGVHVVVGRYVPDSGDSASEVNLTREELDGNAFSPVAGEGRDGQPVFLPPALQGRSRRLYRVNRFNLVASDRIPLNRSLPDVRSKRCQRLYGSGSNVSLSELPAASVVIVFHNEAWSTLLRTVHSALLRSPRSLLREILLVDDASDRAFLGEPLERHVSSLEVPTRVIRTGRRVGLVRARMLGAEAAVGKVLVFLDAHCECTAGWLEALVRRVWEDRRVVACPVIDIVNEDTFAYERSFELHWGAFNWDLHFRWYALTAADMRRRRKDLARPYSTPAMAGGLFAMDRDYFFELGGYDDQMDIWGGENLEMSFRVWMCGGRVEMVPCSHVGHVFRRSSPYSFPGGVSTVLYSNLARVALVWMDDWKEFYFKYNAEAAAVRDRQTVRRRLELRNRLQCRSFRWYLDTVWPSHFFPTEDRFFGKLVHQESGLCARRPAPRPSVNQPAGPASLGPCGGGSPRAHLLAAFVMPRPGSEPGPLATDEALCLEAPERPQRALAVAALAACSGLGRQRWRYSQKTLALEHPSSGLCLTVSDDSKSLVTAKCDGGTKQQWTQQSMPWR
ncbi:polypeptide N-acetylgalactosaminyltransferase 1-like isoform X1 [Schistocerca piceifrons]|uniref:polypeptide N-acetylgalactosaminyltransferase 1-like isoform X1 n=1 Tax=Schistocerca piceifrons TaxID=274613 RepID=UPI001F5F8274|nr:polypeptide N-acetylgalactosaminyltransferase 1-like isoform X1 [Schistocerca piceifrons]